MSSAPSESPSDQAPPEYDPVFLHSRREALIIFSVWVVGLLWAVPFCYLNGYPDNFRPDQLQTILGIPSWVFWGILVPWLAADVFTVWLCFFYMKDDDLGEAADENEPKQEPAHS